MRYKKIILRLRVSKENLYDLGLDLSIIIGWIEIIFWPDRFENKCNEFFYIFVFGVVISFFSIIPIYYEYDVRKEKAFRAYLLGGDSWQFFYNIHTIFYHYNFKNNRYI